MSLETWRPIVGYEGRYEVSSLGRIKSIARFRRGKAGSQVPIPERIMTLRVMPPRTGTTRQRPYHEVRLSDGSPRHIRSKPFLVHRLVARAFLGEIPDGYHVDHVNGIHGDNRVENLRIVSPKQHYRWHPVAIDPLSRSLLGRFMKRRDSDACERSQFQDQQILESMGLLT